MESAVAVLSLRQGALSPNSPSSCPHCQSEQVIKFGSFRRKDGTRRQRYYCNSCLESFSLTTGTPMAYAKKPDQLEHFAQTMGAGVPLRQQAAELGVSLSTVFRWRHRVLSMVADMPKPSLSGAVALVETYIPHSRKGQRLFLDPLRRFVDRKASCVLVLVADGLHRSDIAGAGRLDAETLEFCLEKALTPQANLCSAGSPACTVACRSLELPHSDGVDQPASEAESLRQVMQVANWTRAMLHGWRIRFRGVATRYLHHYLAWFDSLLRTGQMAVRKVARDKTIYI